MFWKNKNQKNHKNKKGSTLIEALVLVAVFSIAGLAFYSMINVGVSYIINSKERMVAISLANERMEMARNLDYDDVAIQGGIPSGLIDPDEEITVGEKSFRILTDVKYYDDPDDGLLGGDPNDAVSNDYKFVSITVSWGEESDNEEVYLSSTFVPPGIESSAGGGALSLNAIDFSGFPVADVSVNLFNDQVAPNVDYNTTTDSNGHLILQGVPEDTGQNYKITLSKSGYETVVTYDPAEETFIPEDVHASILEGVLNEVTLKIDLLSDLLIESVDPFGSSIGDATFDLVGGRRLDDGTGDPVYSHNGSHSTDSSGSFSMNSESPGEYQITITGSTDTDYTFWKISPGMDINRDKVNLSPGDSLSANMLLMDNSIPSVFVSVADTGTGTAIEGAQVRLRSTSLGYDVELNTDEYGRAFFPESLSTPLINGESYEVLVSATDYQDNNTNVTVNDFSTADVNLDPQ